MAYEDVRNESITQTIAHVIDDVRELMREEVALAKAELRHELSEVTSAIVRVSIGAVAGLFALTFLLLGLAQAAAAVFEWPAWGGYLLMAVVLGVCAFVGIQAGRKRASQVPAMPRTVESIKETKEWMTDRMSSNDK